ncbi:Hypothetical predicted protein [Octopus vulgaris]|uniref:Uncharacterized protein n=1 Tax=Octopus vulgaris TaxID=6645 RepID=A0AA36EUU6_OCTVU|nr:Hypothetical predicted protein [Octopus vulgaris]
MSTHSASRSGTSSSTVVCLGELGVGMVVGIGGDTAESDDGDSVAAVVAGVLVAAVGVEREKLLVSFSYSLGRSIFKCLDLTQSLAVAENVVIFLDVAVVDLSLVIVDYVVVVASVAFAVVVAPAATAEVVGL